MKELVSQEAINYALEYVDEDFKAKFQNIATKLSVKLSSPMEYYDTEDGRGRNKYRVYLSRNDKEGKISFVYHDSIWNHQNGKEPTLYDILVSVGRDGSDPTIEFENFRGFCEEFGYEQDSRKAYRIWLQANKQQQRIQSILDLDELEGFPQ